MVSPHPEHGAATATGPNNNNKRRKALDKERAARRMLEALRGLVTPEDFARVVESARQQEQLEHGGDKMQSKVVDPAKRALLLMKSINSLDACLARRCVMRIQQGGSPEVLAATRRCLCKNEETGASSEACETSKTSETGKRRAESQPGCSSGSCSSSSSSTSSGAAGADRAAKVRRVSDLTSWFRACRGNCVDEVKRALADGADVGAVEGASGDTAVLVAAKLGLREMAQTCIVAAAAASAALEAKDSLMGRSALSWAVVGNHIGLADDLIKGGASLETAALDGSTPLLTSARLGRASIARLLVRKGADVEAVALNGLNALMLAASAGHTEIAILLAQKKVRLDCKDPDGCTPLMLAARAGRYETALALAEVGCGVGELDNHGFSALHFAANAGHSTTILALASSFSAGDCCKRMLDQGCAQGNTPLMLAARAGRTQSVAVLLAQGAKVGSVNKRGVDAMQLAALDGHDATVAALLKHPPSH